MTSFTHLVGLSSSPRAHVLHHSDMGVSEQHSKRVKVKLQGLWRPSLTSCKAFIPLYSICQNKSKDQFRSKGRGNGSYVLIRRSHIAKGQKFREEMFVAIFSIYYNTVWFHSCKVEQQTEAVDAVTQSLADRPEGSMREGIWVPECVTLTQTCCLWKFSKL